MQDFLQFSHKNTTKNAGVAKKGLAKSRKYGIIQKICIRFGGNMPNTHQQLYKAAFAFCGVLILVGLFMDFSNIPSGLLTIITSQSMLITDYVEIAGMGAALVNAGIVTTLSVIILWLAKEPFNGMTVVTTSLMAGFSLFGKNFVNIWPIIFGSWLYAKYKGEPFRKYVAVSLLATALAPLVSYMAIGSSIASIPVGIVAGIIVGFVIPPLSGYTYKIQNGLNLYNVGFACGIFALMIVPILTAFGDEPPVVLFWSTDYTLEWGIFQVSLCLILIVCGLFFCGETPLEVLRGYRRLLKKSGRSPSDFLRMFGTGVISVNMGVVGLIGMAYILIIGGELNGPTMGGIMAIMGFGAFGKHPRNITPVLVGVIIGAYGMNYDPNTPSLQLAGLFGTTLAPIAGQFGVLAGVAVGFIHSSLVLQTSTPVAGMNLYNNGFSGGLIVIVAYPILSEIFKRRKIKMRETDFFDVFDSDAPILVDDHKDSSPELYDSSVRDDVDRKFVNVNQIDEHKKRRLHRRKQHAETMHEMVKAGHILPVDHAEEQDKNQEHDLDLGVDFGDIEWEDSVEKDEREI